MSDIIELMGNDLRTFLRQVGVPEDRIDNINEMRVRVDGDQFKASVNFGMWSPPLGKKYER